MAKEIHLHVGGQSSFPRHIKPKLLKCIYFRDHVKSHMFVLLWQQVVNLCVVCVQILDQSLSQFWTQHWQVIPYKGSISRAFPAIQTALSAGRLLLECPLDLCLTLSDLVERSMGGSSGAVRELLAFLWFISSISSVKLWSQDTVLKWKGIRYVTVRSCPSG